MYTVQVPMDAFVKMDIFFFVTTIAVIALAVLLGIALYYILNTIRDISKVAHIIRNESEKFAKGTSGAREQFREQRMRTITNVIAFIQSLAPTKKRARKKDVE